MIMKRHRKLIFAGRAAAPLLSPIGAQARSAIDAIVASADYGQGNGTKIAESSTAFAMRTETSAAGPLECVPFARGISGIRIRGDAHTWWKQAKGRYARGHEPRVGAVMAMPAHGNSTLGHVAAVSEVIDSRTILLSHANWSYPGKIERNVVALDVSENNDWSSVRIWYGPSQALGASHWPVSGFIYNAKPGSGPERLLESRSTLASARSDDPIGAIIAGAE